MRPALLALLLAALPAHAEPAGAGALGDTMQRYFAGEQAEGFAWIAVGDASLAAGGAALAQSNPILRGLSYPLLAVGLIQFVAGFSSLTRTDGRVAAQLAAIAADPARAHAAEVKRIDRLNFLFRLIRYTELTLLGLGAGGAVVGGVLGVDQLTGAGIGVAVEAALMLTLDHFAEARAHRYARGLGSITVGAARDPIGPSLLLGLSRRF
jgi:hypothetical protein